MVCRTSDSYAATHASEIRWESRFTASLPSIRAVQRNSLSATLIVLAAGLLWGTVGPAEILADPSAGPVTLGGARILSGGLVLTAIVLVRDPAAFRALPRSAWPALLAAAAATATFQGTFLTSAARVGAAVATAVTFGIAPVSTGLCERVMLGTRLPRRWVAGTAAAIAGCVLISAPQDTSARADIYGIACGVVAGVCFGVYTVSAKRLIRGNVNMLAATPVTLLLGGAALAPWTLPRLPELAGARSLGLVSWLGPVTVALAYWLYVTALRRLTAATAATLSLAEPFVAAALGIGILHERLSLPVAAGGLLLLGGLTLVSVRTALAGDARRPARHDVAGTAVDHPVP
jgi:drug/metabolite transporter, DME family